jgi:hypothetical protein
VFFKKTEEVKVLISVPVSRFILRLPGESQTLGLIVSGV